MKRRDDITVRCADCDTEFTITADEQSFYKNKGLTLPKRCKACRQKRKSLKEARDKALRDKAEAERREQEERELLARVKASKIQQTEFTQLINTNPSTTLFIIGNGFDIMHGVPSSYWHFQKTLGKHSELRRHLETYLKIEPDKLWYNLEDSLSHINAGVMLDVMDMWLDIFEVYRHNSESMADLHCAIDTAMLPVQVITEQLPKRFRTWVESLCADGSKPCAHFLSAESTYLNFNYTDFLETLYGVSRPNINYIHGCRTKEKGKPKEQLVLGHVPNVDYLEGYTPNPVMVPRYKNPRKQGILEYALGIGISQWISYYEQVFTKHSPEIIEENLAFFRNTEHMTDIFVIGHSLSKVDYPYFEEIDKYNAGKAFWHIGYHSLADFENVLAFVREMGIKDTSFEIFRT